MRQLTTSGILALVLGLSSAAVAQETGGSFGGGDWSTPSSEGGGSMRRAASPEQLEAARRAGEEREARRREEAERFDRSIRPAQPSRPPSDGAQTRPSSSGGGFDGCCCFLSALVVSSPFAFLSLPFVLGMLFMHRPELLAPARSPFPRAMSRAQLGSSPLSVVRARAWQGVDITELKLAIDWRSRRFVQDALREIAREGNTKNVAGLAQMVLSTVRSLRAAEVAWIYGGATNHVPMSPAIAQTTFKRLAQEARVRFRQELVRNADGSTSTAAPEDIRRVAHDGPGVVVVTVLVAARRELMDFRPNDAKEIKHLLDTLAYLPMSDLVAFEVIWSPAAEDDRMSTLELEARYPELVRIDPTSLLGRVFCGYCGGPHAAELARCPHCGAPRDAPPRA
jgi:uncharacterized membrane protein